MICERNKHSRIANIRHIGLYASFFVQAKCGFVSKYKQFDKALIAFMCSTSIYCYPYSIVVLFFSFMRKNLIRGSVTISRLRKSSVGKLNWKAPHQNLSNSLFTCY